MHILFYLFIMKIVHKVQTKIKTKGREKKITAVIIIIITTIR